MNPRLSPILSMFSQRKSHMFQQGSLPVVQKIAAHFKAAILNMPGTPLKSMWGYATSEQTCIGSDYNSNKTATIH